MSGIVVIIFDKVSKYYPGGIEALFRVSFQLSSGEMTFLTGHSGAGKSTLLKLCLLVERHTQGEIIVNGKSLSKVSKRLIPFHRRGIGIIFQKPKLLFDRTVFDNVALPLVIAGFRYQDIRRRVCAALDKVSLLSKEKTFPLLLSDGEQQRVGIARAIVHKPPLLLADEPTGNLDPELSDEIMRLFEQFNRVGMSILLASHDRRLIGLLGHRVLALKKGRLQ